MTTAFEHEVIKNIVTKFNNVKILVNSATISPNQKDFPFVSGPEQNEKFFEQLIRDFPILEGNLINGINYYYQLPEAMDKPIPFTNGIQIDTLLSLQETKSAGFVQRLIQHSRNKKYKIIVSECQAEPWLGSDEPGNSAVGWRFAVKRASRFLDTDNRNSTEKSRIDMWGAERLLALYKAKNKPVKYTKQHEEIAELTKMFNRMN